MKEGEPKPERNFSSSEEIKRHFKDYLQDSEIGTLKYLAFCDYFDQWMLEDSRRNVIEELVAARNKGDENQIILFESNLRLAEIKQANLESEIAKNHTRIKGYAKEYLKILSVDEDFTSQLGSELDEKYPDDRRRWDAVFNASKTQAMFEWRDILYRKEEANDDPPLDFD